MIYSIIVTHNGIQNNWIKNCLDSVILSTILVKIIVVDNCSSDNTVNFIENNYPDVVLLSQKENLGFGKANNIGISYALGQGAEHIFLLNQDAYLVEDVLLKLVDFQKNNLQYGIVSPIHTNAAMNRLDKNFSNYMSYQNNVDFYSDYVLGNSLKPVYEVPFVNAAAWLVSKKCFEKVGGFDPIFFHYGEDDNFCQRVLYHGFKIGVIPSAFIIHDRENRSQKPISKYSREYYSNMSKRNKLNFANVNDSLALEKVNKKLSKLKRQCIKSLLMLKLVSYKGAKNEHALLKNEIKAITKSYNQNRSEGSHYL